MVTLNNKTTIRNKSNFESAAVKVLKESRKPLTLMEITKRIIDKKLCDTNGKTPDKTLYSIISRREKARIERGENTLFKKSKDQGFIKYTLNT